MSVNRRRVSNTAPGTATAAMAATMIQRGAWHCASTCPAGGSSTHNTASRPARSPRSTPDAGETAVGGQ
ncbi:MAG: hypothetical protein HOY79_07760 [Streptomyces sp.]|nr:hypothetical protein [Streptomyces sp.]